MYEPFIQNMRADAPATGEVTRWEHEAWSRIPGLSDLAQLAGRSFNDGLYRVHDGVSGPRALSLVEAAFPEHRGRFLPVGQDWLGRQFVVPLSDSPGLVFLLDVGFFEVFATDMDVVTFHNEHTRDLDDAFADDYFHEWSALRTGRHFGRRVTHRERYLPLAATQCVGYRVPLFLGGSDDLANLEVSDLEVYWTLTGQLRIQVRAAAPGTAIREARVDPG